MVTFDPDALRLDTVLGAAIETSHREAVVLVDDGPPGSLPSDIAERVALDNSAGAKSVLHQSNRGLVAGCNAGVAIAPVSRSVPLVHPTAKITAGRRDELFDTFTANPQLGIASPSSMTTRARRSKPPAPSQPVWVWA